jgi:hypothetical protein
VFASQTGAILADMGENWCTFRGTCACGASIIMPMVMQGWPGHGDDGEPGTVLRKACGSCGKTVVLTYEAHS